MHNIKKTKSPSPFFLFWVLNLLLYLSLSFLRANLSLIGEYIVDRNDFSHPVKEILTVAEASYVYDMGAGSGSDYAYVLNIENPENIFKERALLNNQVQRPHQLFKYKGRLVQFETDTNFGNGTLRFYDIGVPSQPLLISSTDDIGPNFSSVWQRNWSAIVGDKFVLATQNWGYGSASGDVQLDIYHISSSYQLTHKSSFYRVNPTTDTGLTLKVHNGLLHLLTPTELLLLNVDQTTGSVEKISSIDDFPDYPNRPSHNLLWGKRPANPTPPPQVRRRVYLIGGSSAVG
jgi:hypothetical protein